MPVNLRRGLLYLRLITRIVIAGVIGTAMKRARSRYIDGEVSTRIHVVDGGLRLGLRAQTLNFIAGKSNSGWCNQA